MFHNRTQSPIFNKVAGENIFYSASLTEDKAIEEAKKYDKYACVFVFKAHRYIHSIRFNETFHLLSISAITDVKYFACVKEALVTYFALEGEVKFSDASTQKQYLLENMSCVHATPLWRCDDNDNPFLFFTALIPLRDSPQQKLLFELAKYERGSHIKK